jgi:outer membrane lipoprotein LolB
MRLNPCVHAGRNAGWLLGVLFLAGCAALPAPPRAALADLTPRDTLSAFSLHGRFSLRDEDRNYSGQLSWRHEGVNNELLLASPFGQGIAEITTSESGAQLTTSDGKVYTAADSETLTRQVLGYALPLALLTDWVRGRGVGVAERDDYGRPRRLLQDDWRIAYEYDSNDAQALPSRLFAERSGGLELRLRIDEWTSLGSEEGQP